MLVQATDTGTTGSDPVELAHSEWRSGGSMGRGGHPRSRVVGVHPRTTRQSRRPPPRCVFRRRL